MKARDQTAIGAFVVGGAVLGAASIIVFGKISVFDRPAHVAIVFQDSISGLAVGAPVTFRGVQVGSVDSIAIKFNPKSLLAYIPVTINLETGHVHIMNGHPRDDLDLPALIAAGLRAELITQSFVTGQSAIDLDFAPGTPVVLHPMVTSLPEIPTQQSTIQKVQEQLSQLPLHEVADNTNATLQSLRALSEHLNADLPPLVESLRATSDRSGQAMLIAGASIKELQARLDRTLDDIDRLAVTGDRQIDQRGADLHSVLAASGQTMLQVQSLLRDVHGMTSERSATRANLDSSLRDLAAASASLRGFASDVEQNPRLLLTGRKP